MTTGFVAYPAHWKAPLTGAFRGCGEGTCTERAPESSGRAGSCALLAVRWAPGEAQAPEAWAVKLDDARGLKERSGGVRVVDPQQPVGRPRRRRVLKHLVRVECLDGDVRDTSGPDRFRLIGKRRDRHKGRAVHGAN